MVLSWYIFCIAIRMEWEISKVSPALMLETRKCCVATAWLIFLVSFCPFQLLLLPQMTQRQQLALVYFSCLIFSTDIKSLQTLYTYPLLLCISKCIICVWHDNPIEIYTSWDTDAPHTHHHIDPKDRLHDLTYQILYS